MICIGLISALFEDINYSFMLCYKSVALNASLYMRRQAAVILLARKHARHSGSSSIQQRLVGGVPSWQKLKPENLFAEPRAMQDARLVIIKVGAQLCGRDGSGLQVHAPATPAGQRHTAKPSP